jgi:hypothetical protein
MCPLQITLNLAPLSHGQYDARLDRGLCDTDLPATHFRSSMISIHGQHLLCSGWRPVRQSSHTPLHAAPGHARVPAWWQAATRNLLGVATAAMDRDFPAHSLRRPMARSKARQPLVRLWLAHPLPGAHACP